MALTWLRANIYEEPAQRRTYCEKGWSTYQKSGSTGEDLWRIRFCKLCWFRVHTGAAISQELELYVNCYVSTQASKTSELAFLWLFRKLRKLGKKQAMLFWDSCVFTWHSPTNQTRARFSRPDGLVIPAPLKERTWSMYFKLHPAGCLLSSIWALNTMSVAPATPLQYWGSLAARVLRWRERNVNFSLHVFFLFLGVEQVSPGSASSGRKLMSRNAWRATLIFLFFSFHAGLDFRIRRKGTLINYYIFFRAKCI